MLSPLTNYDIRVRIIFYCADTQLNTNRKNVAGRRNGYYSYIPIKYEHISLSKFNLYEVI